MSLWTESLVSSVQVVLAFFEKRKTQRWSLIGGKQEERLYWEQWCAHRPPCPGAAAVMAKPVLPAFVKHFNVLVTTSPVILVQ